MKKQKWTVTIVLTLSFVLLAMTGLAFSATYDFQGQTVTYGYSVDLIERHFSSPEDAAHLEQIEKDFNVNIEAVVTPNVNWAPELVEYLAPQVMSGDAEADVIMTTNLAMYGAARENLIMPLDNFLGDDYWNSLPPIVFQEYHEYPVDGSFYSFQAPSLYSYQMLNTILLIYNKDLLEREGQPDPYELWKAGEWTWDAFKDIATRVTRDTGSGEVDQWGLGERWSWNPGVFMRMFPRAWAHSNNGSGVRIEDGRVEYSMDEPETYETLEFLQELYYEEEAILHIEEPSAQHFQDGELAFLQSSPGYIATLHENNMEDEYSLIPLPKGPQADEHKATMSHILSLVMPITVENPEPIIELTNALFRISEDYWYTDSWEEESYIYDEDIVMSMRNQESMEVKEWLYNNTEVSIGFDTFWFGDWFHYVGMMLDIMEGSSISSTLDANKPSSQQYLDDIFN